ncbi:unnamed protein product [Nezara viridula]|uniref:Uncharacterized protein n=1 Tax=Nezara viridula TaxID=85310 RepID=A0A9P0H7Q7_NEZVI|nr:unnamed protein product [Nezara viridula]
MTKNSIPRCSILKEAASHLEDLMIEVNHRTSSYQEEVGNYQNSENADNKDHSSAIKSHSSVEESSNNEKAAKKGANKQKNYSTNMCDQQQQNNEIPGAAVSEKSMTKLNGDKPTTEPVLNEVLSKRPMTAAERKRKSRAKQRAEGKYQHKQEKCPCGTNMKTRDKLKMEVDALIQRKELLSSQITLLQSQSQQVKLGFIENDSENELSNISTNGSSIECSRSKGISFVSQTKMKGAVSIDKGHEVNSARKSFFVINGMLDDFQVFGEFVARELRNLRSDFNRRRLKRMIQKVIIEVSESDD